jgi:D-alanyl-D-alanine carboxypeptidase/D-alanyl-D-alanine-endopeptidase (penicillin-binding protein 4)
LAAAVQGFANDPRLTGSSFGLSIWVHGYGEIVGGEPNRAMLPGSNQKLLTAMGVLAVLGPDVVFTTRLRMSAAGDLVIEAGGDPSLSATGPHSVDALAAQVAAAGVRVVPGALVVDESRDEATRQPAGWQDWQVPRYAGPLSTLMVDSNRYRDDPAFLADPGLANADLFRFKLAEHGVSVAGQTIHGNTPQGSSVVATLTSVPMLRLLRDALLRSDNMATELLLREIGHAATGEGSTKAGISATRAALAPLCVPIAGVDDDGSGLSRADFRSAREWRTILQAARSQPWWQLFYDSLPLAGHSGTLARRFRGTAADGRVRAKTGTIIGGIALSGYGTTLGGRDFVFSVIVNGDRAGAAVGAVDDLVTAVAADRG